MAVNRSKLMAFDSRQANQLKAQFAAAADAYEDAGNPTGEQIAIATVPASGVETLTSATTLTAADSGKTFFLNSATEFAVTLPAPAAGLNFNFFVAGAPSGASYTVVTASAAQNLGGHVLTSDGAAADTETALTATTITFVDGASVIGDFARVISNGSGWFARCEAAVATGITITG